MLKKSKQVEKDFAEVEDQGGEIIDILLEKEGQLQEKYNLDEDVDMWDSEDGKYYRKQEWTIEEYYITEDAKANLSKEDLASLQELIDGANTIESNAESMMNIINVIPKIESKLKETKRELEKITAIIHSDHGTNDPKKIREINDTAQNTIEGEYDKIKDEKDQEQTEG